VESKHLAQIVCLSAKQFAFTSLARIINAGPHILLPSNLYALGLEMSAMSPSSILARAMESGEFSDLKFASNGQEFKVHQLVVCMQSPVIKAAIQGGFKVGLLHRAL